MQENCTGKLAQNRMLTRTLAKSKTILLMERKSSKEYPVVFLVEGEKFKLQFAFEDFIFVVGRRRSLSYKFAFEDFIFVVGSAANLVGTVLEFASFCSGPDAK